MRGGAIYASSPAGGVKSLRMRKGNLSLSRWRLNPRVLAPN